MFGDVPQLIKLIQNKLLDHGFGIEASLVDGSCVKELVKQNKNRDLKVTHYLSDKHIEVTHYERTKVDLAVQLLSETLVKTLQYFGKRGLLE